MISSIWYLCVGIAIGELALWLIGRDPTTGHKLIPAVGYLWCVFAWPLVLLLSAYQIIFTPEKD